MSVLDKYLTEKKINNSTKVIKDLILKPKTAKYTIGVNNDTVQVIYAGDTLILKYPSDIYDFTYNLIQVCDSLGIPYQEIGMDNRKDMKFIIDLS